MNESESQREVDFSQFWSRLRRKSDGKVTSGALFDRDSFSSMFGEEAADAYRTYAHFTGNRPRTAKHRRLLHEAKETIREKVGVEADVIRGAKKNARIEDV